MNQPSGNKQLLNQALRVFFKDALKVALSNPLQAIAFIRTLKWLKEASNRRARWKREGVDVPPIIIWSITNHCNLQCEGCYNQFFFPQEQEELSDAKMREVVEEARELGVSFFVLAGGEPFLRSEIMNIMKDFPEIIFLVFTNGLLIDDDKMIQLKKQKNVVPLLSLEGYQKETDKRRGEGTYEAIQRIMEIMKKNKIFFGTSLTLTQQSFSLLMGELFIRRLSDSGCKFFLFLEYTPTCDGTEDWILTEGQRDQVMDLIYDYRQKFPALFIAVPWDEEGVGGCLSAARGFIHINARGDLEPCPFAPFSETNIREMSLKEALKSEFFKKIREIPELARETGGGCVLWKERERVALILQEVTKRQVQEQEIPV